MSEIEVSDLADIARLILALFPEEINEGGKTQPSGATTFLFANKYYLWFRNTRSWLPLIFVFSRVWLPIHRNDRCPKSWLRSRPTTQTRGEHFPGWDRSYFLFLLHPHESNFREKVWFLIMDQGHSQSWLWRYNSRSLKQPVTSRSQSGSRNQWLFPPHAAGLRPRETNHATHSGWDCHLN